ncbi:MAG: carbamate kinase [Candidatus Nitrosocaldaceae archaeon]|nr:MAG: carbamate kinase [Candidatus Nitrosocaldaceae archaeon]
MIVVALGGNALVSRSRRFEDQYQTIYQTMSKISTIIKEGYNLVITHGNGPQVGDELLRNEIAKDFIPQLPLFACVAETQGLLGFMIQSALSNLASSNKIISLISRVRVSSKDPAFKNPTKPIGPFYSKEEMLNILKNNPDIKFIKIDDKYRRVVPSPDPIEILEIDSIKMLLKNGFTVITVGGGGIPIADNKFVDAVVDKDLASERLATAINASRFVILTNVPGVYLNYASKDRVLLKEVSVNELEVYLKEGEFGKGSMEPKVIAAIRFVKNTGNDAIIADIESAIDAIKGDAGTKVKMNI